MNEYSVLVYRVTSGYRVDEFIYSKPFERVVNDYITSSNDIVDVKVKERVAVLKYSDELTRCIIDNSRITNKFDPSAEYGSIEDGKNKSEKDDVKMIKVERRTKAIEAIESIDYDDVLGHDDMVKIYESISFEYDTLDALESDLDEYTRHNCLTFDTCLSSHVRVLLDGLTRKEILEHVTGQYGYIELYYLKDDELYAMIVI